MCMCSTRLLLARSRCNRHVFTPSLFARRRLFSADNSVGMADYEGKKVVDIKARLSSLKPCRWARTRHNACLLTRPPPHAYSRRLTCQRVIHRGASSTMDRRRS